MFYLKTSIIDEFTSFGKEFHQSTVYTTKKLFRGAFANQNAIIMLEKHLSIIELNKDKDTELIKCFQCKIKLLLNYVL